MWVISVIAVVVPCLFVFNCAVTVVAPLRGCNGRTLCSTVLRVWVCFRPTFIGE